MGRAKMTRRAIEFDSNYKATNEWRDSLKKSTQRAYETLWRKFLQYVGMSGDQILADRKQDKDYTWEKRFLASRNGWWRIKVKVRIQLKLLLPLSEVSSLFTVCHCNLGNRKAGS
jgi:hypothetical protein